MSSVALEKDEKFEEKNKVNSGHRFCSTLARQALSRLNSGVKLWLLLSVHV
jgi:hypothetical protein